MMVMMNDVASFLDDGDARDAQTRDDGDDARDGDGVDATASETRDETPRRVPRER